MALQTPIGKVRGLGSAREGLSHWRWQRLTAIAAVPLTLWFVFSAMALSGSGYDEVRAWLASPISASLMILLVIATFYHAHLGVQVVIEDYVQGEGAKVASLIALTLVMFALTVACLVAVLMISIGS